MTERTQSTATALIIGGGVIGLSAAYHLAQRKFGRIILLEKEAIGDGASSRAGGIITGLLWTRTGILARQTSLSLFRQLTDDLAQYGYQYQDVGCLNLFDEASWSEREPLLALYSELGVPYEIVDAIEINRRWPALTPAGNHIGLFDPLGGYSEPQHYLPALTKRIRELGVDVRERQLVTGFLTSNGRLTGVEIPAGSMEADVVICTVHSWTLRLLSTLGWQLPVKAFVHQRYLTTPLPEPIRIPAVNANPYEGYMRTAAGSRILVGGETASRPEYKVDTFDFRMSQLTAPRSMSHKLRQKLRPLLPSLRQTEWESEHLGLLSFSVDGEPILGQPSELPGLYLATAFHSGGFAYNPVAGLLLAELVAGGSTHIDIGAFSPDRFAPDATQDYLAKTLVQKDAVQRRH